MSGRSGKMGTLRQPTLSSSTVRKKQMKQTFTESFIPMAQVEKIGTRQLGGVAG
jgi:hypothetical protein